MYGPQGLTEEEIKESRALDAVCTILEYIGEDWEREGLKDTPKRVLRSWQHLFGGYKQDPKEILTTSFQGDGYDQMVLLRNVEVFSTCEHHMLPFFGTASIGYLPGEKGRVVGVSKLARLVEVYARRLQIQERLTRQIAHALNEATAAAGVAVIIKARHLCMVARGVEKQHSDMVTSTMLGSFRTQEATRAEFFSLVEGG